MEQSIVVGNEIVIKTQFFVHKDYSFTGRELILDVFAKHYSGQRVRVLALDGENLEVSGFNDFLSRIKDIFNISEIVVESHKPGSNRQLVLGIFASTGRDIPSVNADRSNAKFVGTMLGRYNPTRLRLAYELDNAFPQDNYMTFQPQSTLVENSLMHVSDLYTNEIAWLKMKVFDQDLVSTHHMGMIDWHTSNQSYAKVWNQFQIEVISETDSYSDFWFTEKTARCLATGKPFVLVAGTHSLQRLRDFGFKTFGSILDEKYDQEATATSRIKYLISSLQGLYNSTNRHDLIEELYSLANENIKIYNEFVSNQREN